ncbi:hypothetical protein, partial [uncultured Corynebacterium sp.]|uniref:hypothetical protein n=1 Tax=uncultured Corynebacterium sp. TaxID=159447 RepID=UPI0025957ABF
QLAEATDSKPVQCEFESHRGHDFKTRFHLAFSLVGAGFCLGLYSLSFTPFHALSRTFTHFHGYFEPKVSHKRTTQLRRKAVRFPNSRVRL